MNENKNLLLKYLSMALTYGVVIKEDDDYESVLNTATLEEIMYGELEVKPYLRPMSSMAKEEKEELLNSVVGEEAIKYFQVLPDGSINNTDTEHQRLDNFTVHWVNFDVTNTLSYLNWLIAHHFDFIGLIPKGLAIEVKEGNNPYKN